jgi:lincosamide nucleotidyltransferase B/F
MLRQAKMIEQLRMLCREDERIAAALLYGSFTIGEADLYSDIECVLFLYADALGQLDRQGWVAQIAPLSLFFADDFGHYTAIFSDLVRGEFHFEPVEKLSSVATWHGNAWFPSLESTILVDRTGELAQHLAPLLGGPPARATPENCVRLLNNFLNVLLMGSNVLQRGERARAHEVLGLCHRYLLWMARIQEETTAHWPTPSKRLEEDISAVAYQQLVACTARLDRVDLWHAYHAAWQWGRRLAHELSERHGIMLPEQLFTMLDARIGKLGQGIG